MSTFEKRALLMLCSLVPPYLLYFGFVAAFPQLQLTMLQKLGAMAVAAGLHAIGYLSGLAVFKLRNPGDALGEVDERDRAIDGHATRIAYFVLLTGTILVGVVLPFERGGWAIVQPALLVIVLAETTRHAMILRGYRRAGHAH